MVETNDNVALKVIQEVVKMPMVKVNREEFLIKIFGEYDIDPNMLIEQGPAALFSKEDLDKEVSKRINLSTMKSTALSFSAGLPGGFAMAATIPADIAQFYGYAIKLAQEISYIYGYKDLFNGKSELTEEGEKTLILYLGVMLGVTSAGSVIRVLSTKLATQQAKQLATKPLMKTFYYPIIKKVLANFGTKITKSTFSSGVSKAIPVVGGFVSGGLNFATLKPMANKLKNELGKVINYTEEDFLEDVEIIEAEYQEIIDNPANLLGFVEDEQQELDEQPSVNNVSVADEIMKAHELFEKAIITEEEFAAIKQRIINN